MQSVTQTDIERVALELGAPRAGVYKWRERGEIPARWQLTLLGRFPHELLKSFGSLPRKAEPVPEPERLAG